MIDDMIEEGTQGVLSHHRVQQRYKATKQKYSIEGDHILEGFGTFGSLPARFQTAG